MANYICSQTAGNTTCGCPNCANNCGCNNNQENGGTVGGISDSSCPCCQNGICSADSFNISCRELLILVAIFFLVLLLLGES